MLSSGGHSDWRRSIWVVSAFDGVVPAPFELEDGTWLFAAQTLAVRESHTDGQLWLTTLSYTYQWQSSRDDGSWIARWCYGRETPSGTTKPAADRAHLHVNGVPSDYAQDAKHFPKLHLPAGRIGIEDLAAFLVREHGVPARSENWEEVLEEARQIFANIQARRT
jgi:hypothetical protein